MLSSLKSFLARLADGNEPDRFEDNDYRIAAAALLVHAMSVDGVTTEAETDTLRSLLQARFDLDDAATRELIAQATAADRESVDLYSFTSLLNRALDDQGRRRVVAMLWEMALADGRVNEFEDNLIWRVADLLHVPSRERIELRQQIAGTAPGSPEDA